MTTPRIAIVTGANKGIGLAIVRSLALSYPTSALASLSPGPSPLHIYLTARDATRGASAVQTLTSDPSLSSLHTSRPSVSISFHALDITSAASISAFTAHLSAAHPAGIDLLVNNAGVALDGFSPALVAQTLACNYTGTLALTRALLPLLRARAEPSGTAGRVVNVSSVMGALGRLGGGLPERFRAAAGVDESGRDVSGGSVEAVTGLMEEFEKDVQAGRERERGWGSAAYPTSKAGVTGMSVALAREEKERRGGAEGKGVVVNACCPGYVNTDMTKGRGVKTVEEGARTPVLLALGDLGGVEGRFWSNGKVVVW